MSHAKLIEQLLKSDEPSVRWKARVKLLGEDRNSSAIKKLEVTADALYALKAFGRSSRTSRVKISN